jgi:hypothetical protein
MPAPAETQTATIEKFIEGWKTKDPGAWTTNWTDDCTNTILPFSMKHPGWSKQDVEKVHLPRLFTTLSNWKVWIPSFKYLLPGNGIQAYVYK